MRTEFSPEQLADPAMASSEAVIRKCVHCGFCTATCPTYTLLGDELDSPRGRIYLIKDMLENEREPTSQVVKHVDRCLSCLACMTTCPSDVNYMHLVDHARAYIHEKYKRPWHERLIRSVLAAVLPHQKRFRFAAKLGRLAAPFAPLLDKWNRTRPFGAMLRLARNPLPPAALETVATVAEAKGRVAILQGCAEPVLRPETRAATLRLLARAGYQPVLVAGEGCCGALVHHMGREGDARRAARRNVGAWCAEIAEGGLEAILVTASGCGTTLKDYGFMLRDDPEYAADAARVSALVCDVSEFLARIEMPAAVPLPQLNVAYHSACSLQHGQKVTREPVHLLEQAGFTVLTPAESHLCCGSAGTYNILQPEIATQLRDRKISNIEQLQPDVIAAGNIGCTMQLAGGTQIPIVHTVELLDWVTGGPIPSALADHPKIKGA